MHVGGNKLQSITFLSVLLRVPCDEQVGVSNVDQQALQQALAADVITFGSPSAVK
jgi:hypothetical protein